MLKPALFFSAFSTHFVSYFYSHFVSCTSTLNNFSGEKVSCVPGNVDQQAQPYGREDVGKAPQDRVHLPRVFLQEGRSPICHGSSGGLQSQESSLWQLWTGLDHVRSRLSHPYKPRIESCLRNWRAVGCDLWKYTNPSKDR